MGLMSVEVVSPLSISPQGNTGGYILPSDADHRFTERILKAGALVKVEVEDHLIISEEKFFSMAVSGDIEKFRKSKNYEMIADLENQMIELQKQAEMKGLIKGERKAKIAVAKKLIKFGKLSDTEICSLSGLSKKEFDLVVKGEM